MAALAGKLGAVYMSSGSSIAMTDEATTCLDPGTYTQYQITDTSKRYVDKDTAVTVKVNGTAQSSGWTIDYVGGIITFDSALTDTDTVTVSGAYFNVSQVAGFFNWEVEINADELDTTEFGSSWRTKLPVLLGFNGRAEMWWADASFLTNLGQDMIVVLYVNTTNSYRYEGYAKFATDTINVPVDALINEPLTFQGEGELYYRSG